MLLPTTTFPQVHLDQPCNALRTRILPSSRNALSLITKPPHCLFQSWKKIVFELWICWLIMDSVGGVFTLDISYYYLNGFPRAPDPEPRPELFPLELLLGAVESIFSENGRRIDKFSCPCPPSLPRHGAGLLSVDCKYIVQLHLARPLSHPGSGGVVLWNSDGWASPYFNVDVGRGTGWRPPCSSEEPPTTRLYSRIV